jgi:hypothetical protein
LSENYLNLMKLKMGRSPSVDAIVNLGVLIEACAHYFSKNEAIAFIVGTNVKSSDALDETNAIYLSAIHDDKDALSLLLVRGDPGRAIPSYVNTKKRTVKTIKSDEPGDVPGASSHLVISKQEIAVGSDQGRHRMAIERTRGLSKTLARDFLGNLLARFAEDFPQKFIAEKKKRSKREKTETIQYRPTLSFNLQQNGSLQKDLQNGRIGGFKLVHGRPDFQGDATQPKIQRMDVQLHASITPTNDMGLISKLIASARSKLSGVDFEDIKLELVDEHGDPMASTQAISIKNIEDADMRYCKTLSIPNIAVGVPECHADFYEPILSFCKKVVHEEKHWK